MNCYEPDSLSHVFYQVMRLHYNRTHMLLDKVGIYPGQPAMLFVLHMKDGQNQKELATKLNIKPATITVMLGRMEKAELVERKQDPEDKRMSMVYLTDKGRELCTEVNEIVTKINKECFSNFTVEEEVLLRRFLMQMRDNLKIVSDKKIDD